MTLISLIAAVDENLGLGKNNQLLCHLPADLAHFKKITMNKPIIMGRKTFDSIGRPLPGRQNIILSRHATKIEGVNICSSLKDALNLTGSIEEVMVIGGADLFKQALPVASRIYLTIIHSKFDADVFFPEINEKEWSCINRENRDSDEKNAYSMSFLIYEKL